MFARPDGRPSNPNIDYHGVEALLAAAELRDGRLHEARHTARKVLLLLQVPTPMGDVHHGVVKSVIAKRYRDVARR